MKQHAVSFDGCRIVFRVDGPQDAPVLMLSHPIGASLYFWEPQMADLSLRYRVIRHDSRGHGRSDAPTGEYGIEMLGRDALAVLDEVGVARTHFVGLSQGGMTGMWLGANAGTRIDRLVIANSLAFVPVKDVWGALADAARVNGLAAIAEQMINGWLGSSFKAAQPEKVRQLIDVMGSMSVSGFIGSLAVLRDVDLRDDLRFIESPVRVITGSEDNPRGVAAAEGIAAAIAGADVVRIDRAGHLSSMENPAAFIKAISDFLA